MDPISSTDPIWYFSPPPPKPNAPEPGPLPDRVQLESLEPEMRAVQTLRKLALDQGKAPLPGKLDLHSVLAGQKVASAARSYERSPIRELTGKLPGFQDTTAWPETSYGNNNQCANFVSSFAQRLGLKGHYNLVPDLEAALKKQGWKRVSPTEAGPGDVWVSDTHTELVTGRRGHLPLVTGSNNGGRAYQTVSSHLQQSGRFYTRPLWRQLV
ncbi:hypothetical protein JST97_04605 [bacterium]|nr:hypothetical protein [bacterium]